MHSERAKEMYRPVGQRIRDYDEVERFLTTAELAQQSERCLSCGTPFCHGSGCPLYNVIPEINAAAAAGHWELAYHILSETSNFPEFTGRVCPALCEGACVNGIAAGAVMIRQLEKAVIEKAFAAGWVRPVRAAVSSGRSVAVIGAGPAGLAAADELNRRGHAVTVFEKAAAPGGLLRYGIPNFKLEKTVIERRIKVLAAAGVIFECNTDIGRDVSVDWLRRRFDAVVAAIGTPAARDLPVPGRKLDGIHFALELLGRQNQLLAGEAVEPGISLRGKKVLVIGGGDTGSDCVGTAVREEAASIRQIEIMPSPPEQRSASTPWPDWPYLLRTSSSQQEGGERRWNLLTERFVGKNGRVTGVEVITVEWELSESGRPLKFRELPGAAEFIPADIVLLALGFTGVPQEGLAAELGLKVDERGRLQGKPAAGIFVCGDAARGQSLVVRAIADAREAAAGVDNYLLKES